MNYVVDAARTNTEPLHIARARDVDDAPHKEVIRADEVDRERVHEGVGPVPPALSKVKRGLQIVVAGGRWKAIRASRRRQDHTVWPAGPFLAYRNDGFSRCQSHLVEWQSVDLLTPSVGIEFVRCVVDFWYNWLTCLNDTS